jgi:hypothetical protein
MCAMLQWWRRRIRYGVKYACNIAVVETANEVYDTVLSGILRQNDVTHGAIWHVWVIPMSTVLPLLFKHCI